MSVRSFEDFLEFVNNKLTKNSKLSTTADDETIVVVGSDKLLAVGPVHAQTVLCRDAGLNVLPRPKCQTLALLFQGVF